MEISWVFLNLTFKTLDQKKLGDPLFKTFHTIFSRPIIFNQCCLMFLLSWSNLSKLIFGHQFSWHWQHFNNATARPLKRRENTTAISLWLYDSCVALMYSGVHCSYRGPDLLLYSYRIIVSDLNSVNLYAIFKVLAHALSGLKFKNSGSQHYLENRSQRRSIMVQYITWCTT